MKKRASLIVNTKGRVERVPCLAAEPHMTFTHGMMAARLAMGALASLAAGTKAVVRSNTRASWVLAVFLLAAFIPVRVRPWAKFPVWHHLVFLGTLVPLILLGTAFPRNRSHIEAWMGAQPFLVSLSGAHAFLQGARYTRMEVLQFCWKM